MKRIATLFLVFVVLAVIILFGLIPEPQPVHGDHWRRIETLKPEQDWSTPARDYGPTPTPLGTPVPYP